MVVVEEQESVPLPPPSSHRRLRRWPVAAAVLVALVVASAVWWVFNPRTLGATASEAQIRGQIGRAVYLDTGVSSAKNSVRNIDIRSVRPVIESNTAAATVGVLLCHTVPGGDHLGGAYDLSLCASVTALRPGPFALDGAGVQIIYAVTPNARGIVRIAGVDVTYRDGIRRGHQRTGIVTIVNVP